MPKYDKYHPNYKKMYPGIEDMPEILAVLKKSDRKMEYMEVDIKRERFVQDQKACIARFLPSREDSYERILEDERLQFPCRGKSPEEVALCRLQNALLRNALEQLTEDEKYLIRLRYWHNLSQAETAAKLQVSQQVVSYREKRILGKLRKLLEK